MQLCESQDSLLDHVRQLRLQGDLRRAIQILRDSFESRRHDHRFLTLYGRLLVDSREIYPGLTHCREVCRVVTVLVCLIFDFLFVSIDRRLKYYNALVIQMNVC